MMKGVGSGLTVIKVRWRNPFGDPVSAHSGCPASFGELVVRSAAECQMVDIGFAAFCPRDDMVDFGEVRGHVATWMRAPTILGVQDNPLCR